MTRGLAIVAAVFLIGSPLAEALTPEQRQLNIQSFEYVWATIRDKHWQTEPGGLDWQAIHDEFRPKVEAADSMEAARAVLNEMLGRLHETHFGVVPGDVYSNVDRARSGDITTGIDVRVVGAQVLVTSVQPDSSASAQGVRPGWEVVKIGSAGQEVDLAPIVAQLNQAYAGSSLRDLMLRRAILGRLQGNGEAPVQVEFLDGAGKLVDKSLAQGKPKGDRVEFGYLTPMQVWFNSSRLGSGNIEYAAFNVFLDGQHLMTSFGKAVEGCAKCEGFIVDLRGNPGGIGAMAMGMAGWFISQPNQKLGTLYMRSATLSFVVNPRLGAFLGPLAILVDGASASTSEIMAEGLKDLGRARIFGTHTAAAALPSLFERLPNGDGFQYAIANYVSEGGKPLEGLGVTPDVETPVTREALLAGKDPALDAAVAWIQDQKQASK